MTTDVLFEQNLLGKNNDHASGVSEVVLFSQGGLYRKTKDTLGKTLSQRSEIAAKIRVEFFLFSSFHFKLLSHGCYPMVLPHFLLKKLSKMPKFTEFTLVNAIIFFIQIYYKELFGPIFEFTTTCDLLAKCLF